MNKALIVIAKELSSRGFEPSFAFEKIHLNHRGIDAEFTLQSVRGTICISTSLGNAGDYVRKIMKVDGEPTEQQVDRMAHYYNVMYCGTFQEGTTFGVRDNQLVLYRSFTNMPLVNDVFACIIKLHADVTVFSFTMKA